uniref:Uncharacterized protein MANES_03G178600 n=1 Tax=Rhizophora mucronata TaxID=61149 RepID=A0A2P2IR14_RHIMU
MYGTIDTAEPFFHISFATLLLVEIVKLWTAFSVSFFNVLCTDLGFAGGKSKSLYGRDGHLGITLIKFSDDHLGLKEAVRLAEFFEKDNHGRRAWDYIQPMAFGKDDEKNPDLVKVDWNGGKQRILYGYLLAASDLCKVDFETRKKVRIESQRECNVSQVVSR